MTCNSFENVKNLETFVTSLVCNETTFGNLGISQLVLSNDHVLVCGDVRGHGTGMLQAGTSSISPPPHQSSNTFVACGILICPAQAPDLATMHFLPQLSHHCRRVHIAASLLFQLLAPHRALPVAGL